MNGEFYIDIGRIRLAHDYVLDRVRRCAYPHGREAFGLVLAITGGAEYRFATGERLMVEPGEVLFLSAGVAYTIVTERAFRHVTINFDIHRETSALGRFAAPYHLIRPDRAESISRRFRRIAELWRERTPGYEMQAVADLYELFSLLDEAERVGHPSHRLSSAREYIEGHFASAFSLGELADLSGMSLTSFRRAPCLPRCSPYGLRQGASSRRLLHPCRDRRAMRLLGCRLFHPHLSPRGGRHPEAVCTGLVTPGLSLFLLNS